MQRKPARLTWCGSTLLLALWATLQMFRIESRSEGALMHELYHLAVFAVTPLVFVAWVGAGAVVLARIVRYRGGWYFVPQAIVGVLMLVRFAGAWVKGSFRPGLQVVSSALSPATPRWALLSVGVIAYLGCLMSSAFCMSACVAHGERPVAPEA